VNRLKLLDVIAEFDRLPSPELVADLLARTLGQFGLDVVFVNDGTPRGRHSMLVESGLPRELSTLFQTQDYLQFSPVARMARHSFVPVLWTRETWINESDQRAHEFMRIVESFGIHQGLVVPVRGPAGVEADVSLSGARIDIPPDCVPLIQLLAYYGFVRTWQLNARPARPRRVLTARDRDVLAWAAHGKSTLEIAEVLGISTRSVEEHVRHACRRLGASNRTAAVAIAMRDGLITL
jgi:LuxR family transcriptional regulator, quorum-sensing system regulator BjaR1